MMFNYKMQIHIKKTKEKGFSLIEVVLAVGVASFALVGLLGMLPAGLKTFKNTMDMAVGTQIAQRVTTDLSTTDWANITSTNRYFDEQGNEVSSSSDSRCVYWVQANIATNGGVASTVLPGNKTSTNLLTVNVIVVSNPGGGKSAAAAFSATNPNAYFFPSLIGRAK